MRKESVRYVLKNSNNELKKLLIEDSPKSIFLVTGNRSYEKSGAKKFIDNLLNGFTVKRFSDFADNPKIEDVNKGINIFLENSCDYLIAIGGGSVMDMAKLINIGYDKNNIEDLTTKKAEISSPGKKLIAIPTTSGSGSEATHFAVVYVGGEKFSVAHPIYMLPNVVVLNPSLTYSMNSYQTALSGVDAFAQAMESYWSINSTEESKKYSIEALKLIIEHLPLAVKYNDNSKNIMLHAANLAGKAINIAKTSGAHAISYVLTSKFNIPHGQAVALTLPAWYNFNHNCNENNINDSRGLKYLSNVMMDMDNIIGAGSNENKPSSKVKMFIKGIGLETSLSLFKVHLSNLDAIVDSINIERLNNNPAKASSIELNRILKESF
jgi:alcohol dehydrogenase class IV|tara:strand:- start:349 stop:1488 length:1140 start_codon:yes stop_codon:yes gene_type:complete